MKVIIHAILFVCTCLMMQYQTALSEPIQLHPQNPHYFQYKDEPMLLITSAEHYGAVINLDFDYETYLKTLHDDGLNYTRIFTGTYVEKPGAFGIQYNTLAPQPERFIAPWARSATPGYSNRGNLFDLDQWDQNYFDRLESFLSLANEYNIIVEVTLFSSIYSNANWEINPFNSINNINDIEPIDRLKVHTLDNGKILDYQIAFVKKIVQELNDFDNIFFEIQNEPYGDLKNIAIGLNPNNEHWRDEWEERVDLPTESALEWQDRMTEVIVETEANFPKKHLIAQNISNFFYPVKEVNPNISILNFHYAWPKAALLNYGLDRVIGFDESGFSGDQTKTYRKQAWKFILSGGGLYNNLDYTFTVGNEDGTDRNDAPGLSDPEFRTQMRGLKQFVESVNYINMQPGLEIIQKAPGVFRYGLANPGEEYAFYFTGQVAQFNLTLDLPDGNYEATWISTIDGSILGQAKIISNQTLIELQSPEFETDIALRVKSTD